MSAFRFSIRKLALLAMAVTTTGFGARMIDYAGPAEARPASRPEETEAAVTEMEDDDDSTEKDDELSPEMPEGSEDDLPVAAIPAAPPSRWKWSQSVTLGLSTDDNIYLSSNHKESDQILTLTGHFQLLWGLKQEESFLRIDYLPSLIRFEDHSRSNGFDQTGELAGQWRMAKLTLGVQAEVQSLSGADLDVGTRTTRRVWQFALQARYDLSTKTLLEVDLAPSAPTHNITWVRWSGREQLGRLSGSSQKLAWAPAWSLGYLKPEGGQRPDLSAGAVAPRNPLSEKLTFNASGGHRTPAIRGRWRHRRDARFPSAVTYKPSETTEISLEASRQNFSSASCLGQNFTTTGGTITSVIGFRRLFARVTGGYEDADYMDDRCEGGASRHDQYLFVRPALPSRSRNG